MIGWAASFAVLALLASGGAPAPDVRYVPAGDVRAAFEHGAVLLDGGAWMVHASRREAPGMAEVHDRDTDIIHVLGGSATIVTGGRLVGGRRTAPDETRGDGIAGGVERRLGEGDVLVVPAGVPHWFRDVDGPFLYYVVKVAAAAPPVATPTAAAATPTAAAATPPASPVTAEAPFLRPAAVLDLNTAAGLRAVAGAWRYSDARVVEVAHREPGPDRAASGAPNRTWDIVPHAGAADFDDAGWEELAPGTLDARRGHGRLSFNWYRLKFKVPERVGAVDLAGATAVLEVVVDDYAEIWVDGRLPLVPGQSGGALVGGYNAPNRVVLRDLRPGQTHTVAVFGANGPLSRPPANFIWMRSAALEIYPASSRPGVQRVEGTIRRLDPGLDDVIARDAVFEKIAGGFLFTEGPVWHPDGYLLFSDPNANAIYRWSPEGQVSVFRAKSGYAGADIGAYRQPGSNGLTIDAAGRLTIDEHGNRRVVRLERNGVVTPLAERFEGKRLNSPNDLVYRSDGALYFTDPPFGLPKAHDDPNRELPFSGVFLLKDDRLTVVARELSGPNGLALSPDERILYVGDWDPQRKVVMRYDVRPDGTLGEGAVFADFTADSGEDAIDGIKVDRTGTVYISGPGGLHILAPDGRRLGLLVPPEHPHNMAFGDADGKTLYLAAQTSVYRVRVKNEGIRPAPTAATAGGDPAARMAEGR